MATPNPPNAFLTLQILKGNGATPEVFSIIASINTQRSFKMDFNTAEYYIPDPANPGKPIPKSTMVTGYGATMDVSGVASANDIVGLIESGKTGNAAHYKLLDLETNKATATLSMKLTGLTWEGDPTKGEPTNFSATLAVDGDFSFADVVASGATYQSLDRTLASGANETLDVNGGGLVDRSGSAVAFTKITEVEISAASTNTTNLTVGAATYPFLGPSGTGDTVTLVPGDSMVWRSATGWTVSAGVNDQIKIANGSGATAKYNITIKGS